MDLYSVLQDPITTEKSTMHSDKGKFVFLINKHATKVDVKNAVKLIYGEEVAKVAITQIKSKSRYVGRNIMKKRKDMKKAVITMKSGKPLDITKFKDTKKSKPKKK